MKKIIPFTSRDSSDSAGTSRPAILPSGEALAGKVHSWNLGSEQQQLLLMQRLIGCTSIDELVSRFYSWCSDLGLGDGLTYEPVADVQQITLGNRRHHSASYSLSLDNRDLGTLILCRRERFSEAELLAIEQALGTLARCLRTAFEFQALRELVTQDPLTGLGNRSSLHNWIDRELSRARRHNTPLTLMMIDVDHFKKINDHLGHLGGDRVLKTIADAFKRSTRASDLLFRFGGDEFTVLLPHTNRAGASDAARQIRESLARMSNEDLGLSSAADTPRPDVSIGIASYQPGDTEESLLQRADTHLYHAKALGRGMVCSGL